MFLFLLRLENSMCIFYLVQQTTYRLREKRKRSMVTCVEKGGENVTLSNVSNAYHNGVRYNQMGNTTDLC